MSWGAHPCSYNQYEEEKWRINLEFHIQNAPKSFIGIFTGVSLESTEKYLEQGVTQPISDKYLLSEADDKVGLHEQSKGKAVPSSVLQKMHCYVLSDWEKEMK